MSPLRFGLDYRPALLGNSGIGRYVRQLVEALPAVLGETELALFGVFWQDIGKRALTVDDPRLQLFAQRFPGRILQTLGRLGFLSAERFTGPVDLFHSTDYVEIPLRTKCSVTTIHDLGFLREPRWYPGKSYEKIKSVTKRLVERSRGFIADSEATKADLVELLGVDENRIEVALLGVSDSFFETAKPPSGPPQIAMIATLEPRKNHLRLLRAFEQVAAKHQESRLVIVGRRGWLDDDVVEMIQRLEDGGQVSWLRNADEAQLHQTLAQSSIVVYPSLWEGFGLPVLEGMASGRAVLTSDLGSMKEVAGEGALLIDPTSESALAEGLDFLLSDANARADLGALGQARARIFTWESCAQATFTAWQRFLGEGGP